MSATQNITDSWMEQIDVQSRIKDAAHWEEEWFPVYERLDSYIEHFYGLLLPVSAQRAARTMTDPSWGRDFNYSLARIAKVLPRHTHYLGLRFRRSLALEFGPSGYFSIENGIRKRITRRNVQDKDTGKTDAILVRRDAVLNFVESTKQVLLWCVCSQRYSERKLDELDLVLNRERFHREWYCYDCARINLNGGQKAERPRMATMTEVFGKRIVLLRQACGGRKNAART
jgi:hypothetical protein